MPNKPRSLDDFDFDQVAAVLRESDDLGVVLRGHVWIEVLLEFATRSKLDRPDAIDWNRSRFEQKLSMAEAVGALDPELAAAVRDFNRLRNRLAHNLLFSVPEDDAKALVGRIKNERVRNTISSMIEGQMQPMREIQHAHEQGWEVEIDPEFEWYPRVMNEARANLFAFVCAILRDLAFTIALDTMSEPHSAMVHLDSTLKRLTGGMFSMDISGSEKARA